MPSITLANLGWSTPDGRPVLSDIDLRFQRERVGVVGRNGVGKSTLLYLLSGERRLCTRGAFNMVALRPAGDDHPLAPLEEAGEADDGWLRTAEMVFPGTTNHYGTLFGGEVGQRALAIGIRRGAADRALRRTAVLGRRGR